MDEHRNIIILGSSSFLVRKENSLRMVFADKQWMDHSTFVDFLYARQMWDELCELVKLGMNVIESNRRI